MLKRNPNLVSHFDDAGSADPFTALIDMGEVLAALRRQWPLALSIISAFLALGLAYLAFASPRFTATASIMIDARKNQLFRTQQIVGELQVDSGAVESQVEILKSETVALAVIRDLKLAQDPEFMGAAASSLAATMLGALGVIDAVATTDRQIERKAAEHFARNLSVKRIGASYVIDIAYTSLTPARSAQIANAIAESYMLGELDSKYHAIKRASRWLQDRMADLRAQASAADSAVQTFKTDNNIIDTGRGLMSDQQLSDVNAQLIAARAATAEAKARLDRIDDIARTDMADATVADALRNSVITRLRAQYLDLAGREADWSARYGAAHAATINLRAQMQEIKRSINDELGRIGQTYKSDHEIAKAREASIESSLLTLVGQNAIAGQAQIKLRDLESASQASRNLYDSFFQRSMEATQQQTFPVSEARVITAASEPLRRSAPKTLIVLGACGGLGLILGVGAALARERLDKMFRTASQVEETVGVECLGVLPMIATMGSPSDHVFADRQTRTLTRSLGLLRYAIDAPFARFTETLRGAKVAADVSALSQEMRVIGVASTLPSEGKTTIASNIAHLVAHAGQRALLIDGDLRNPVLTRMTAPAATEGLLEILTGARREEEVIWTDPVTGLDFLPAIVDGRLSHPAELLSSTAMAELLSRQRQRYDYIFIDLPPIAPVVDVRAATHLIDGFLLVIEWGRTTRDVVREAMRGDEVLRSRMIGAVLNKADPATLRRLESYKGRSYRSYHRDGVGSQNG